MRQLFLLKVLLKFDKQSATSAATRNLDKERQLMTRSARGTAFHNGPPTPIPENASSSLARAEFAKRLQRAMAEKGLSQSELARRASVQLGKPLGRDSVSQYIRAETLPNPERLTAISKVLGVSEQELLPTRGVRGVTSVAHLMKPGLEVHDDTDDERFQQVNIIGMRVKKDRMKELLSILYDE